MASKEELMKAPGVCASPDAITKDFVFQQVVLLLL